MMYRMTHRDCSEIRARRAAQRRAVIAVTVAAVIVCGIAWMVLR